MVNPCRTHADALMIVVVDVLEMEHETSDSTCNPSQQRARKKSADTFLNTLGEQKILRTLDPKTKWSETSKSAKSEGMTSLARIVKAGLTTVAPGKEADVLMFGIFIAC